ncbi:MULTISPECIES: GIY-YIG nuclease family protein [Prochlorococcus]|uniref:Uncharacterized conserved protein n=1 Tax=Prochlorococcus marinus (strain SARG / CCMP1375 / SS120) TaxID=167539 RepID=Q7VCK8_PROMA|nr:MULTISPECIES: GIY-YIG nuclease family protein [Prochlorococcus]AAP99776.1 Uncharacterized conserved protein [Prochlorococcus marinus subsp. marinus str. CCMP1375]KGG12747.1 putative NADH-ubiquinone/plastoquinone [Prochlorococcus marinus str. LG]KGG22478.1 putative NADH-ubiquinone/plastoquinone [Prochlorococcus marinus str. SS2]KGG23779.1 putative NADH-ubiquinone/plastoquinone [Prochlorococcus marinus str. SS35]KGG32008.1 putative NADH-ubiquinone/plastoquinone [Prochlorococcus marinus str. S
MEAYIYLIKNGDLYNIGTSNNLQKTQDMLGPGELCASLKTKDAISICRNLHLSYSDVRLPKSDYFRLSKSQLIECKLMLRAEGSDNYFQPIFRGRVAIVSFLTSWLVLSGLIIKLGIDPILEKLF